MAGPPARNTTCWPQDWDWCSKGKRPCDGWSAAQNQQTLAMKDGMTRSSEMMELWDYYDRLDLVFLYISPRTESLYLFFTQALGIQLWGGSFCCPNTLF